MRFCYFVAGLDQESFELLISLTEIPTLEDYDHHYDALIVEATLKRICDECDEFIEGLHEHGGDEFGLKLLYHDSNSEQVNVQTRPICELCLVDGSMSLGDAVVRLIDIKSTADLYLDELQESTLELIPAVEEVNWKVEGF